MIPPFVRRPFRPFFFNASRYLEARNSLSGRPVFESSTRRNLPGTLFDNFSVITARTLAETPHAKRRHEEKTAIDPLASMRAAVERWQHARAVSAKATAAELPEHYEASAPRVFL